MKLLFDQNISFKICHALSDLFPGSTQVRLAGLSDASDRLIWNFARENGFAIVSFDSDFAEMAALLGPPPKIIWLRCGNRPTAFIEALLRDHRVAISAFKQDVTAACLEIY